MPFPSFVFSALSAQPHRRRHRSVSDTMKTSWKDIPPVPTNAEFVDIVLSSTQRRLPTQIRAGFQIARIRAFYTRKVKFTAEGFSEKLTSILTAFPRLADLHPFCTSLSLVSRTFGCPLSLTHLQTAVSSTSCTMPTITRLRFRTFRVPRTRLRPLRVTTSACSSTRSLCTRPSR